MTRNKIYWICQVSGWGTYALANLALVQAFGKWNWTATFSLVFLSAVGLVLTHAIRHFLRIRTWLQSGLLGLTARVIGTSIAGGLTLTIIGATMTILVLRSMELSALSPGIILVNIINLSIVIFIWLAIYFGVHYLDYSRKSELQAVQLTSSLKEAELSSLKTQLNPHFLFNSLNTIRALTIENPTKAHEAITKLSNILRYTLQARDSQTAGLKTEMQIVRDYLEMESLRFEDRLNVRIEMTPEVSDVPVPVMSVQTLVENAIKHGISRLTRGGNVDIVCSKSGGQAEIRVTNSGAWVESGDGTQVGLANIRQRLQLIYGERASLEIDRSASDRVSVRLKVPV